MLLAVLALGWTLAGGAVDERSLDRFLADLHTASDRNDRRAIAGMVHYPLKVLASGWVIPVNDRATFVTSFEAFFTEEIRDVIADAAARPQPSKVPDLVSLGNGAIRIMRINGRFAIIGITVPPSSGRVRGARRGTTLVSFPKGQSTMAYSGTLARGEHESYVVRAVRNQLLEVRVNGVSGRAIVAHVFDEATKTPLDARAGDGTRGVDRAGGRHRRLPDRRRARRTRGRRGPHLHPRRQRTVSAGASRTVSNPASGRETGASV